MMSISLCLLYFLHYTCAAALEEAAPVPVNDTAGNDTVPEPRFSPFSVRDDRFALATFAKVNWFQAQAICASQGMTLVSISAERDQQVLRNFLYIRANTLLHLLNELIWTSGTDLAEENTWTWFSNGRSFSYRNFQSGAPKSSTGAERCLGYNGVTSLWQNVDCQEQHYFICERRCAIFPEDNAFY
ncbi:galactose-specific lectin nattectin-like [Scaptodrosophila lebanonensis]|uniref:Galactose-specific lectin nattectin-like n=1 Tax=Drosophila lebanonensis TaxID=7225 RepID=A0A6J2TKJ2_DROLE|nr:galactose-specific lectin nattectin-like [Scaptodrosophila lebanonensis]